MGWPTADDFSAYLPTSYAAAVSADEQAAALEAAIGKWSDLTGYWPFMSTGNASEERIITPRRGHLLDLNGGLVAFTSLATEVSYMETGSLTPGTAQVANRDFRLKPSDAPQRRKPWTYIETGWRNVDAALVRVVGEWGFCTAANLPTEVKRAVMALAARDLMPQIMAELSRGGLKLLQRGDERKEFVDPAKQAEIWAQAVDRTLANGYVRDRIV